MIIRLVLKKKEYKKWKVIYTVVMQCEDIKHMLEKQINDTSILYNDAEYMKRPLSRGCHKL